MKRILAAAFLMAVILISAVWSNIDIIRVHDSLTERIEECIENPERLPDLKDTWLTSRKKLYIFVNHERLNDIHQDIFELEHLTDDPDEFRLQCRRILIAFDNILNDEKLNGFSFL